jgi:hypothetical protein
MSLKKAAEQVRRAGRGADTELVHFTKGEVRAMQGLAKAAGGKLTRNPETGMMEAGFLRSMLPTILGFAANFVVPGSGMIVGGLAGAATNKEDPLMGAFMGGLGGYGGGNLAAGMQGAGAAAAQNAASAGASTAGAGGLTAGGSGLGLTGGGTGLGLNAPSAAAQAQAQAAQAAATQAATTDATMSYLNQPAFQQASQGAGAAFNNPQQFITGMGGNKAALQAAGMAAAPALMMQPEQQTEEDQGELPGYDYAANPTGNFFGSDGDNSTRQRQYFNPTFTRRMAEGGETDAAAGMSGASADAMRYLMGQTSASNMPAMQQGIAQGVQQPTAPAAPADPSKQFMYDAATHSVIRNPGYVDPAAAAAAAAAATTTTASSGSGFYYDSGDAHGGDSGFGGGDSGGFGGGDMGDHGGFSGGGLMQLAKGGMASGGFVVPADVVAMVGEGNTDAGYRGIRALVPEAVAIKGRDGGQADTVKTSIDGKQPARVAHGEMYLPPEAVKRMGGAEKLYAMMDRVRAQATGSTKQMKPVSLKRAMS